MEDQELEPLEKAIQTAHSNFFVEEESFIWIVDGWICLGNYRLQSTKWLGLYKGISPIKCPNNSSVGIVV